MEDEGAIGFIARLLRLDFPDPEIQGAAMVFAARFQQTTGPVMAKALEDTVFYRYNRLIALNEVGGEPDQYGAPVSEFHDAMRRRLAEQPYGLSTTATHDTKRGEDARARLYAISEMADEWRAAVARWQDMLAGYRREIDGTTAPEPEFEWLFYQSLAGIWPADLAIDDRAGVEALCERLEAYMLKVLREAKLRTSWTAPVQEYEDAVAGFVRQALDNRAFLADLHDSCRQLWLAGAVNSLSQLAIKIMAPGVPDIYQGTEFWDLSLVDPDNRRPFDYASRQELAAGIDAAAPDALLRDWIAAAPKMRLMKAGLNFRRDHPALSGEADYVPLETAGARAEHVVAFARLAGGEAAIVVATRLPLELPLGDVPLVPAEAWGDTRILLPETLAARRFGDVVFPGAPLGGGEIAAADALGRFPVALLYSGPGT